MKQKINQPLLHWKAGSPPRWGASQPLQNTVTTLRLLWDETHHARDLWQCEQDPAKDVRRNRGIQVDGMALRQGTTEESETICLN